MKGRKHLPRPGAGVAGELLGGVVCDALLYSFRFEVVLGSGLDCEVFWGRPRGGIVFVRV